jgi:hypothetical protein
MTAEYVLDCDLSTFGCLLESVDRLESERVIQSTYSMVTATSAAFGGDDKVIDNYLDPHFLRLGMGSSKGGIEGLKKALGQ